jgi:hypothetical protein
MKNYWKLGATLNLGTYPPGQEMWFSLTDSDTKENYDKNPSPNWAEHSLSYKYNNQGFRSRDFEIQTDNPILLTLGCSHTVGVGIPVHDNWPEQLGNKYFPKHLVYNAGLGGAGADTVARLAINLIPILKPNIVAILWPSLNRFETYHHDEKKDNSRFNGIWSMNLDEYKVYFEENNAYNNQMKNKLIVNLLKKIYDFKYISLDVDQAISDHDHHGYLKARDNQHFCGWWHRDVMEDFYKQYMQI